MRKHTHAIFMIGNTFHGMKMYSFDPEDKESMIKAIESLLPDFWYQFKIDTGNQDYDFTLKEIRDLLYSLPSFSNDNARISILDNSGLKQLRTAINRSFGLK